MISFKPVGIEEVLRIRQEVMYPGLSLEEVGLPDDGEGEHIGLYEDEKLVTIVSLFRDSQGLQFRKLATLVNEQGKGYGKAMMRYIFERAENEGMRVVWCNARRAASALYRQFGMHETGESWIKHDIEFIKMERNLP